MALACSRCGAANPDGNSFCYGCGNALAAVAPVSPSGPPPDAPPPIAGPPPSIAPPSYQSPYYAPAAGVPQAPVHRTSWVMIASAVLGLVVVMAGCGTALAVFNSRNANQLTSTGIGLETPSPAGTPTPAAQRSPGAGNPGTASNPTLSVTVPSGWLVASKDNETITLMDSDGESITIGSGPSNPPANAQQNKADLDKYLTDKYPDAKLCPNTKVTAGSISGAGGLSWEACFTLTSGSQSVQAAAPMFAGANADGSVYYVVILLTPLNNLSNFLAQARPVVASIQWLLK